MDSKFTYKDNEDIDRGDTLDPIKDSALIHVISVNYSNTEIEYICKLTDMNLEKPVTFSFTINRQESRVVSVKKLENHVETNKREQAQIQVWTVLGNNDTKELLYGIHLNDKQRLPRIIEWDLYIDGFGELDYTHLAHDLPPYADTKD
jgi:hypothetical protein